MLAPIDFFQEDCCNCGIIFLVPKAFRERKVEDKSNFYCPNGHSLVYRGKTKEQILNEKINEKNLEIDRLTKLIPKKKRK